MEELYRKYRPSTLEDVVGMETAIKALDKELNHGSHVFLMAGESGCGKTTLARIMARKVGATENSIHEINSANNRGIDTAREIMEQMVYVPFDSNATVWILDEVHQLTSTVQNAFLKAFEDTPPHVYFFLCTTNQEKLIKPLKNRCSIINVKPLTCEETVYLLKTVAKKEERKVSNMVCNRIFELSEGSPRKSLKLLSKVLWLDDTDEMMEVLEDNDDETEQSIKDLCIAIANGKSVSITSSIVKKMDLSDPERTRLSILAYLCGMLQNGKVSNLIMNAIETFGNPSFSNGKYSIMVSLVSAYNKL